MKHNFKLFSKYCVLTADVVWMRTDCGTDAERMGTPDAERVRMRIECGQRTIDFYLLADAERKV